MKIAYICTGLDPKCSGKIGCFKQSTPHFDQFIVCHHTCNENYALNGPCENPEAEVGTRFERYICQGDNEIRYFEIDGSLEREAESQVLPLN